MKTQSTHNLRLLVKKEEIYIGIYVYLYKYLILYIYIYIFLSYIGYTGANGRSI